MSSDIKGSNNLSFNQLNLDLAALLDSQGARHSDEDAQEKAAQLGLQQVLDGFKKLKEFLASGSLNTPNSQEAFRQLIESFAEDSHRYYSSVHLNLLERDGPVGDKDIRTLATADKFYKACDLLVHQMMNILLQSMSKTTPAAQQSKSEDFEEEEDRESESPLKVYEPKDTSRIVEIQG